MHRPHARQSHEAGTHDRIPRILLCSAFANNRFNDDLAALKCAYGFSLNPLFGAACLSINRLGTSTDLPSYPVHSRLATPFLTNARHCFCACARLLPICASIQSVLRNSGIVGRLKQVPMTHTTCLLYTSDAADE